MRNLHGFEAANEIARPRGAALTAALCHPRRPFEFGVRASGQTGWEARNHAAVN